MIITQDGRVLIEQPDGSYQCVGSVIGWGCEHAPVDEGSAPKPR